MTKIYLLVVKWERNDNSQSKVELHLHNCLKNLIINKNDAVSGKNNNYTSPDLYHFTMVVEGRGVSAIVATIQFIYLAVNVDRTSQKT